MKRLLILPLALCAGTTLAQKQNTSFPQHLPPALRAPYERLDQLLSRMTEPVAAKTTAAQQRVIAESTYGFSGGTASGMTDTNRYAYTALNGSAFNLNGLTYRNEYNPIYGIPTPFYYNTGNPYKIDALADSVAVRDNQGSLTRKEKITYNSDMTVATYTAMDYSGGTVNNGIQFINSYVGGLHTGSLRLSTPDGIQWDTVMRKIFLYNAAGKLTSDTIYEYDAGTWIPRQRDQLLYLPSGALGSLASQPWDPNLSSWTAGYRYDFTYYPGNKVKEAIIWGDAGGSGLIASLKDSFSNDPGIAFYKDRYQFDYVLNRFFSRTLRHLNAQNLPDTVLTENYNGSTWQMEKKSVITYNSFDNPVQRNDFDNTNAPTARYHYYYELYNEPNSVNPLAGEQQINVYPNPAVSELRVECKNADRDALVGVSLIDLSGQKVYNEQLRWKENVQHINTAALAPGLYLLSLTDAQGRRLHVQSILKQ